MAVYPNIETVKFCEWLLNVSWFKLSSSQLAVVNTVYNAALVGGSVTDQQYNNFTLVTSWRYKYYEAYNTGVNYQGDTLTKWLSLLKVQPSASLISDLNTLINTLNSDGNLVELDRLWIFGLETEEQALLSLVNPEQGQASIFGGVTFTPNSGYSSIGIGNINLNFKPLLDGNNYTQNNASYGIYNLFNGTNASYCMGVSYGSLILFIPRNASNIAQGWINGNTALSVASTNSQGLFSMYRYNSSNVEMFKNGVTAGTASVASVPLTPFNLFTLGVATSGTYFSLGNQAIIYFGSSNINPTTMYSALQTFATARGFNV